MSLSSPGTLVAKRRELVCSAVTRYVVRGALGNDIVKPWDRGVAIAIRLRPFCKANRRMRSRTGVARPQPGGTPSVQVRGTADPAVDLREAVPLALGFA